MIRRRRWTKAEDDLIRQVALENRFNGISDAILKRYENRLQGVADKIGRTYAAVRIRASRIGALSYEGRAQRRIDE